MAQNGITIRNFANAIGGVFYNGGVPYDATGAILVSPATANPYLNPSPAMTNAPTWVGDYTDFTPTVYFDPSQTSATSTGVGTLANPFYAVAQINTYITTTKSGAMAGEILGIKRGTTCTETMTLDACRGALSQPFIICPYGSTGAAPVISGASTVTAWTAQGNGMWTTPMAVANVTSPFQLVNGVYKRIYTAPGAGGTTLATKQTALTTAGAGYGFWDSGSGGLWWMLPYNAADPTTGIMTIPSFDYGLSVITANTTTTGHVWIFGIVVKFVRGNAIKLTPAALEGGVGSVSQFEDIRVVGCSAYKTGLPIVDANNNTWNGGSAAGQSADGILIVGGSDTVRINNVYCAGNYFEDIGNNAIEIGRIDGGTFEYNYSVDCHGNGILEMYTSSSNIACRYNRAIFPQAGTHYNVTALATNYYHGAGVWAASQYGTYATPTADATGTTYNNNVVIAFNEVYGCGWRAFQDDGTGGMVAINNTFLCNRNSETRARNQLVVSINAAGTPRNNAKNIWANNIAGTINGSAMAGNDIVLQVNKGTGCNFKADYNMYTNGGNDGDGGSKWTTYTVSKTTIAAYRTGTANTAVNGVAQEANSYIYDAALDANGYPRMPSRAMSAGNAGVCIGYTHDLAGVPLSSVPIGPYQFQGVPL